MEINYKAILSFAGIILIMVCLMALVISAGCITAGKQIYSDVTATPIPTPTPATPTPTPAPTIITPEPTPAALPTTEIQHVDPYEFGMRSEGQWFKWWRTNVQGLKDLQVGIVAYRHAWLDRYSWWNAAQGNIFQQNPDPGMRFFVVWINEEVQGENQTFDPGFWGFDERAFRLQVNDQLYEPDTTHNPVNRIIEFDNLLTYHETVTAPPFSYHIRYTGHDPKTGGFAAQRQGVIRMGQGNGFDGYILFQIPKYTQDRDIILLGNFGTFGSAQWTFTSPQK